MTIDPALRPLAERPDQAAVLLDFDGSLASIVDDPAAAKVLPEARAALAELVARIKLVAIVSGRPVDVLAHALALDGIELVGQYGLERRVDGRTVVDERVAPYAEAVAAAADEAERELPGLLVERKAGVAGTVHWRTAPERDAEAIERMEELARRHGLVTYATRMARELRPPVPVDKGTAVESLLATGFFAAAFAGDDRGDLPAFDALDRAQRAGRLTHAVRVAVGSSESPPELLERSDLVVEGPAALAALLAGLAQAAG
ncbi:MAG TPA: trehalose-phosphatase [Acidimicrobiia bacterium]|nr:trehalose-phosphatase [Acidimicrobiia bacterium]